jgi:hypothetical protein
MYEFKKILEDECIGNTLSSINLNFESVENWTNNIQLSSKNFYKPLVDFYKNYGDFWKSSINFSNSINAQNRLSTFSSIIETNSAKFIKPIVIFYPDIFKFDNTTLESNKTTVTSWFKQKYPVNNNSTVNFVENSFAFIYMMFYKIEPKISGTTNKYESIPCSTNDVSVTITCRHSYKGDVSCGYKKVEQDNICGQIDGRTCGLTNNVTCLYENGLRTKTRTGTLNVDHFFEDRWEYDTLYIIVMKVKNCEWEFDRIIQNE